MKSKFILLTLAAGVCLSTVAAGGKKKTTKKNVTVAEKVDTVCIDTFSYAMGAANSQGLKEYATQRLGVEAAYWDEFCKGMMEGNESSVEQKKLQAYVAGLQIRKQVDSQIIPNTNKQITDNDSTKVLNDDLFREGFITAAQGGDLKISVARSTTIAQKQMEYYQKQNTMRKWGAYKKECEDWLAANAKKDSVITLKSGVQYKVLHQGNGPIPTDSSTVKVNYRGRLIDGTEFDSSYKRNEPAKFRANQVIKGWTEALTRMPIGSKWEVYIPQQLAYGAQQTGQHIKPFSALIFEIELVSIEK